MKYLRRYQENMENFCNSHLSYLIDQGFNVFFGYRRDGSFAFGKEYKEALQDFKWDEVKYDFIPFLEVLVNKYNIDTNLNVNIVYDNVKSKDILMRDLLDDSEYLSTLKLKLITITTR